MRVVPLACPRCGAPLVIGRNDTQVTCGYCGLACAIQRDRPPADRRDYKPATVYAPAASSIAIYVALGGVGLVLGTAAAAFHSGVGAKVARSAQTIESSASISRRLFFADQPLLVDTNHDGHVDVVGKCRPLDGTDQAIFAAFDGKTGALLWRSPPLTKDQEAVGARRVLLRDKLFVLDALGIVQAFRLTSGKPAWRAKLPDVADVVCESDGQLAVRTADTSLWRFAVDSGTRQSLESGAQCRSLVSNDDPSLDYRVVDENHLSGLGLNVSVEGMSVTGALVVSRGKLVFPYGTRRVGTPAAMVAAVSEGKVLWRSLVPSVDPLRTSFSGSVPTLTYAAGRLVVPYSLRGPQEGVRVTAFDGTTGHRLWDIEIQENGGASSGIAACPDTVYYATNGYVYALNLADGSLRFATGVAPTR